MPATEIVAAIEALLTQLETKVAMSLAPGTVVLALAPQADPAVVDQLVAVDKLPPAVPIQYLVAALAEPAKPKNPPSAMVRIIAVKINCLLKLFIFSKRS